MKPIYFTAGPSQLHQNYLALHQQAIELNVGSIGHRTAAFRNIYNHTVEQLKALMNIPSGNEIYFAGSATEIWERMIVNLAEKRTHHFVNGSFSNRFYEFAIAMGKQASINKAEHGYGCNYNIQLPLEIELICTTQNETSAGVSIPISAFETIKANHLNSLICTDIVSIAPISALDYSVIDSSFFSVQKAFGMPSGLGVWIVNQDCIEKAKQVEKSVHFNSVHHTISSFHKHYQNSETPSTPNVLAIYMLGKIAEQMNQIGIQQIRKENEEKSKLINQFIEQSNYFSALVNDEQIQSKTVIVLKCKDNNAAVLQFLKEQQLIVSSGYGATKLSEIRIANFPSTSIQQIEMLIAALKVFENNA